ncbi:MAG: corrinoid protein [archaeon YNP-LCB-003-016]|uniref:cobalamin B12-binding domain-containing protein n=1 Tax=Candidatus Culexarchaeum yellowstonense TaxID=2928963 RepID=UPI0026F122C7|nr:corrinoid protein [Candidatus Culexarchaeum yellowstonense]MCR6691769.1 corrinoid protein [Candidatus Culexarchaeum yellowstonense]
MDSLDVLRSALLSFDEEKFMEAVKKSLEANINPLEVINVITDALQEIGRKFEEGEIFLVHLVTAGEMVKKAVSEYIEPSLKKARMERKTLGKVVIGTVAGDIHDIGKNIVATLLFSAGFEVIDLGKDVPVEEFIKAVKEHKPDVLGLSALLTTTMPVQKEVIEALKKNGLRDKVKVIVGGAPVTTQWAEQIGADGYAENGVAAVKLVKKLLKIE